MSNRIECPSESWDRHCEQEERANTPTDDELIAELDAYGHLTWAVGYSDEWSEDNVCPCPMVWEPGKPVKAPEYRDDSCTKCGGREHRGDWLACFDFKTFDCPDRGILIAYHVVVNSDSGGFIDELESGVVTPDKAPFDLPDYWASVGMEGGTAWSEEEVKDSWDCNKRWNEELKRLIEQHEGGKDGR